MFDTPLGYTRDIHTWILCRTISEKGHKLENCYLFSKNEPVLAKFSSFLG